MNINRNLVRLATTGAIVTVAGVALAAPASAALDPGEPSTTYAPSPTSVELTRLVKLNVDNRPLSAAIPEIRRLVTLAGTSEAVG